MSYQDRLNHYVSALDKELSKYPLLVNLEKQTGAPKAYVIGGLAAFYFLLVTFNFGGQTLTNLAGFIVPGYYSLSTLFSVSALGAVDSTQWITYWMIFAFFTLLESVFSVTYWVPFYYALKLLLLLWCGLPQTAGAQTILRSFLAPLLAKYFAAPSMSSANLRSKVEGLGNLADKIN